MIKKLQNTNKQTNIIKTKKTRTLNINVLLNGLKITTKVVEAIKLK